MQSTMNQQSPYFHLVETYPELLTFYLDMVKQYAEYQFREFDFDK